MKTLTFCKKVITIPQYLGTCWYNVILMAFLYGENSRTLLLKDTSYLKKQKDKLSKIFLEILTKNYIETKKNKDYFLINKPEEILKNHNLDKEVYDYMIENGWLYYLFLNNFIKYLGKTSLFIDYYDNILYVGMDSSIVTYVDDNSLMFKMNRNLNTEYYKNLNHKLKETLNPDYLFINIWDPKINSQYATFIKHILKYNKKHQSKFILDYYKIKYSGIKEFNEEIIYNGDIYILDSCILSNYNRNYIESGHAIVGIKCKNEKYIYNGWMRITSDNKYNLPCELMQYNWDIKNSDNNFCINSKLCKIDLINDLNDNKNLCFSFAKGERTLIYVKKDNLDKSLKIINIEEKIKKYQDNIKKLNIKIEKELNKLKKLKK